MSHILFRNAKEVVCISVVESLFCPLNKLFCLSRCNTVTVDYIIGFESVYKARAGNGVTDTYQFLWLCFVKLIYYYISLFTIFYLFACGQISECLLVWVVEEGYLYVQAV